VRAERDELVAALRELLGPLELIDRRRGFYETSFAIDELDVELESGERLELLFKDVGPQALAEGARAAKPSFLYDPEREIQVYRDLLAPAGLGTPELHGTLVDPDRSRYWLFIARVPGVPLWQIGELERWQHVARWLAAMHERFAADPSSWSRASHLLRYDAHLYGRWPQRARELAGDERREQVGWLLDRYPPLVERLAALPLTFLHGEFYASNVIVPERAGDERVCPIDWELAAIGPAPLDLAALVTGGWEQEQRDAIAGAYWEALEAPERLAGSEQEFRELLDVALLYVCIQWLGWAEGWTPPAEHRHDWLGEGLALAKRLGL
jgi:Ser/Thr protein kinase RdoA (MazF antagonist)